MNKLILLLVCVAFSGCSSNISKSTKFNEHSSKGLAAFNVDLKGEGVYSLTFMKYDPESKKLQKTFAGGFENIKIDAPSNDYYYISMEPGIYAFRSIFTSSTNYTGTITNHITCLSGGTFSFSIEAGEILAVNNIYYDASRRHLKTSEINLENVKNDLKKYRYISGDVKTANVVDAEFLSGINCGTAYAKDKSK